MNRNARLAMLALKKLGAPVIDRQEYNAYFLIGGELRTADDQYFCDYYQEELKEHYHPDDMHLDWKERRIENPFGIRTDVHNILKKNGLYAEWINGGLVGVYPR